MFGTCYMVERLLQLRGQGSEEQAAMHSYMMKENPLS